jgi:SAM-dependent methyltransferase
MRTLLQTTALWRLTRGVKRSLRPARHDFALPPEQCRGSVAVIDPPVAVDPGRVIPWRVRVLNQSGVPWASGGSYPVRLGVRWLTPAGDPFGDPVGVVLPRTAYPGEPVEFTVPAAVPGHVGDFTLEVGLEQDGQAVGEAARVAVPVVGGRSADIDYHAVYRTADLGDNHWWVVGQYKTRADYEKSQADRRGMLVAHGGLTPDSRVLDIGCGTGQMAAALADYLSPRGAYFGTDIGKEAIDFCHRAHRRPNFVFRQGGMTTVPFGPAHGAFDLAIFFSVFTHTFADETVLLLSEAHRLLGPKGCVMADVIASPLVERAAGNRGEMIVNRDHFLRLAAAAGFPRAEVVGKWRWNPQAERFMFRLGR